MASKTITDLGGFVKIDRKILNWEWWDDVNVFRLFVTILLLANWEDKSWHGREIKRGQLFTSISSLSKKSGLTVKQTRLALNKLIRTHEVAIERASNGTLLTVVNYDVYQSDKRKRANKRTNNRANEGQTKGKRGATTKETIRSNKEVIKEQQEQQRGGGSATIDLNELLSVDDIVSLGKEYADVDSLIREVEYDANLKGKRIRNPYGYVCGYAINVGWPRK